MSNFLSDAESAFKDTQGGSQGGAQNDFSGGNNQSGGSGLMGDAEQALSGGGNNQQSGSSSSGGGLMGSLEQGGENQMVNQEVNGFLSKEGVPSGADSTIDKFADQEAGKFM